MNEVTRLDPNAIRGRLTVVMTMPGTGARSLRALIEQLPVGAALAASALDRRDLIGEEIGGPEFVAAAELSALLEVRHDRALRIRLRGSANPPATTSVVCAVREPIARIVALALRAVERDGGAGALERVAPEAVAGWIAEGRHGSDDWQYPLGWLERNVRDALGVDVFAEPFDAARGWRLYESERARLLLVRREDLAKIDPALEPLFGSSAARVDVPRALAASGDARFEEILADVRARIALPDRILERAYEGAFAPHFYGAGGVRAPEAPPRG